MKSKRKNPERIQYFLVFDETNVAYTEDQALAYYLDKTTGEWVRDAFTWRHLNGIGGDSDSEEVDEKEARKWVHKNLPGLLVNWP